MSAFIPGGHPHIQLCVHWTSQYHVPGAETVMAEQLYHSGPLGMRGAAWAACPTGVS